MGKGVNDRLVAQVAIFNHMETCYDRVSPQMKRYRSLRKRGEFPPPEILEDLQEFIRDMEILRRCIQDSDEHLGCLEGVTNQPPVTGARPTDELEIYDALARFYRDVRHIMHAFKSLRGLGPEVKVELLDSLLQFVKQIECVSRWLQEVQEELNELLNSMEQ